MLNAVRVGRNNTMGMGGKAKIQARDSLLLELVNYYTAIIYL